MFQTYNRISKHIKKTPLEYNIRLSKKLNNNIYLKREDLQLTRSFKIRGSLNKMLLQNLIKSSLFIFVLMFIMLFFFIVVTGDRTVADS